MKKILKYLGGFLLVYLIICLATPFSKALRNRSIKNQINYLAQRLDNGYDNELQLRFPEGKLFSNCLLALSIIEFCESNDRKQEKYARIVDNCIKRIQSEVALRPFNPNLEPKYGMFYNAWSNYVYVSYQQSELFPYSSLQTNIIDQSDQIERRLKASLRDSLRLLNSYAGASWPADNLIGALSQKKDTILHTWVDQIRKSSEHPSGLIPHAGSDPSTIRGSSSAMITFCLSELKMEEVRTYNQQFQDVFVDRYLGVQLVRENEDGSDRMDADSGPILLGYGASATIMNIKTQARLNKKKAKHTYAVMNLISCPVNLFYQKFHLMKKEPMLDLFLLWGSVSL